MRGFRRQERQEGQMVIFLLKTKIVVLVVFLVFKLLKISILAKINCPFVKFGADFVVRMANWSNSRNS